MEKKDCRKLSGEAQAVVRGIIIRMKEQGRTLKEISAVVGCSLWYISRLWRRWKNAGGKRAKENIIGNKKRGRRFGENRTLSAKEEKRIQNKITGKYPDQLMLDFALWTRAAVQQLIWRETGIDMPIRTVGEYLKRWGYTPQKPVKYAYERKAEAVQEWLEKTYPEIQKRAKRQKGEIYWGDETGVSTADVRGRGYAPAGETPTVMRTGKREQISMISAITNRGKVYWKIHEGSIDSEKFLEFVKRLVQKNGKKVFLILDNLKIHKSKILIEWVQKNKGKIELNYLPAYSPDLNPDEYLNADVKYGVGERAPKKTKEELSKAAEAHMKKICKDPERIKKYFKALSIQYAA